MNERSEHINALLKQIPHQPGVYQYFNDEGVIIYVGKAKDLHRRVNSYFQKDNQSSKTRQLVAHIRDIRYVVVESEQDAFLLENNLIKQYQPHYNILLKDGKSYPSICITREPFPRIFKTRTIVKSAGEYYGPYSFGNTVDLVIELLHKLYPIRTCNMPITAEGIEKNKYKVCLKYHIKTCGGICEGYNREEYREWVTAARKIIKGDAQEIIGQLEQEMAHYASEMEYEKAGEIKRKLELLNQFCSKTIISNSSIQDLDVFGYEEQDNTIYIAMLHVHNGSIVQGQTISYRRLMEESKEELLAMGMIELREQLGSRTKEVLVPFIPDVFDENIHLNIAVSGDKKKLLELAQQNVRQYKLDRLKQSDKLNPDQRATRILGELQQMLQIDHKPMWIDSFDNSNIQGQNAVAGCVVFKKGKPSKSDYKKFNIKTVIGADDYASMREVVRRRYQHLIDEQAGLPDLIIADGGIGQMHAIREVVEDQLGLKIPIAGLKKDDKHRTQTLLFGFPPKQIDMPITSEVFRLMVQIQDEVHRFAITFHKKKRSKAQIKSQLDDLQGVGTVTKQKILLHFGSLQRARSAKIEEWQNLLGKRRGSAIYEQLSAQLTL
ncbi:MAG: excinuclease ABC subunit C [Paludibacteraceae bacterium]|jgi:excinuclease ABC subunit C|nr:excinuclease ABC subunit C [Paludibacteraceae bacterium]